MTKILLFILTVIVGATVMTSAVILIQAPGLFAKLLGLMLFLTYGHETGKIFLGPFINWINKDETK